MSLATLLSGERICTVPGVLSTDEARTTLAVSAR